MALSELVFRDLHAIVDELYPEDATLDPVQRAAAEHEAFARSRAGVYIGRRSYFEAIDEHVAGDGTDQPLVVVGESGLGKSALLANWALRYRQGHPKECLVMHFIGSSPESADWASMLRRAMAELAQRLHIDSPIPSNDEGLREAFTSYLYEAGARSRVVLVLDALNQLDDRDGAPDLVWLPPRIPRNVRVIVSTLPHGPVQETTRSRAVRLPSSRLAAAPPSRSGRWIHASARNSSSSTYARTLGP